tara:strand:- start:391 stop:747 length:357 start_codon:yes stop_codon:yes gene_type:complete
MFYDEELFWLNFGELITNIVTITVIVAEVGLVIWLVLLWLRRNFKWSPVIKIGELSQRLVGSSLIETEKKVKKDLGPIEVDIKKQINITEADISDLKSDEEVKGKVKTQKNKLRSLTR